MTQLLLILTALMGSDADLAYQRAVDGVQVVYDAIVKQDGTVDYAHLHKDKQLQRHLSGYVGYMQTVNLARIKDKRQKIAVLANAYNVFTLIGVNRAWPVASVTDIKKDWGFFSDRIWNVGGRQLSLNDIENEHLRALDVRIHVLVNCASVSCPKLMPIALTVANVETVMEKAMIAFLNDATRNRFDATAKTWRLSQIFNWYGEDWGKEADIVAYIRRYRSDLVWNPKKVTFLEYDWRLNGPTN